MKPFIIIFHIIICFPNLGHSQNDRLEYYPMNVGDERRYLDFTYNYFTDETTEVRGFYTERIIGDTILDNGEKYFIFEKVSNSKYEYRRIDSTSMRVFEYHNYHGFENKELDIYYLNVHPDSAWFDISGAEHWMIFDTSYVNNFGFIAPKIEDHHPWWSTYYRILTKGIGLTHFEDGDLGVHDIEYLVYAKINGVVYDVPNSLQGLTKSFPSNVKLYQNYPNPFNSITNIKISVHRPMVVSLIVFDVTGRFIESLIDQDLLSGERTVTWDAKGNSSGIYYYQLQGEYISVTKKLILLK